MLKDTESGRLIPRPAFCHFPLRPHLKGTLSCCVLTRGQLSPRLAKVSQHIRSHIGFMMAAQRKSHENWGKLRTGGVALGSDQSKLSRFFDADSTAVAGRTRICGTPTAELAEVSRFAIAHDTSCKGCIEGQGTITLKCKTRCPRDHTSTRILQTFLSGISLSLGLRTRM